MQTTTVSDRNRAEFQKWVKTKAEDWFGYSVDDPLMFECDGEDYIDAAIHSAWMGWQAYRMACEHAMYDALKIGNAVNNEVTNGESSGKI